VVVHKNHRDFVSKKVAIKRSWQGPWPCLLARAVNYNVHFPVAQ